MRYPHYYSKYTRDVNSIYDDNDKNWSFNDKTVIDANFGL